MGYLLDTDVLCDLICNPMWPITHRLPAAAGQVATSVIVTANPDEFGRVPGLTLENWLEG